MSKHRIKSVSTAPQTRLQMEELVGEIMDHKLREISLKARMDKELQATRERYQDDIEWVQGKLEAATTSAREWAEAHVEEFGKARSLEMIHGVIGWRIGQPTLKTLSGWTWDRVLDGIRAAADMMGFVRVKEEVNRQGILAAREQIGVDKLRLYGLRVTQSEEFYIEPRITPVEQRPSEEVHRD